MFVSFKRPVFRKLNKSNFSQNIIKEYQNELYETYGVFVNDMEAQMQLQTLVRSMFPKVMAERCSESRELGAIVGDLSPPCTGSLSDTIEADVGNEVGAVLPRLRDIGTNKIYE